MAPAPAVRCRSRQASSWRPDLEVIAVGGDGGGYSIAGNHFVHACRRDVNMVYLVMDNGVLA
jgi:pyruvate/2-oxoacid:ferredoxin oxidoreductase beta subunit